MAAFKITTKKDFNHALKLLKKRGGGEYNQSTQTWVVDEKVAESLRQYPEYFTEVLIDQTWSCFQSNGELKEDC